MFHLFTHAFFKALLFLCAGVIIHRVHSNEMKDMGGLRKVMPVTHICFLIACLAIAGIPPFSGFFSKEDILLAAWHANKFVYWIGLFTSGLTAFYMFRLYFSVFWARPVMEGHVDHGEHGRRGGGEQHGGRGEARRGRGEAPGVEKLPLLVLAIGSLLAGLIPFSRFVTFNGVPQEGHGVSMFGVPPIVIALIGMGFAAYLYRVANERPERMTKSLGGIYQLAYRKFYIDEVYTFVTKKVIFHFIGRPAAWIDRNVVDGFMNLLARMTARISAAIKGFQSGKVQDYALYFFAGIAGLAILFIYIYT